MPENVHGAIGLALGQYVGPKYSGWTSPGGNYRTGKTRTSSENA